MARGAAESGAVESYMNAKVRRNPLARGRVAEFLGEFRADKTEYGFTKGTQVGSEGSSNIKQDLSVYA